jgi:hypothetical protein
MAEGPEAEDLSLSVDLGAVELTIQVVRGVRSTGERL